MKWQRLLVTAVTLVLLWLTLQQVQPWTGTYVLYQAAALSQIKPGKALHSYLYTKRTAPIQLLQAGLTQFCCTGPRGSVFPNLPEWATNFFFSFKQIKIHGLSLSFHGENKNICNRANFWWLLFHFSLILSAGLCGNTHFYLSVVFLQTALRCPMDNGQIIYTIVYNTM